MSTDDNQSNDSRKKLTRETLIDRLTKEIESNLNNDQFGVDSLAQAVGMSRSSLHRKLEKLQGVSTSQFIREYRLKRALEILRLEDVTASEVAYRVGFGSATYFNTCFHKFHGYTPGEVKSRIPTDIEEQDESYASKKEYDLSIETAVSKSKKNDFKNILILVTLLIPVTIAAFYFYHTSSDKSVQTDENNVIDEKSIVILPFKNWTGDPDLEYISDGMTDAVTSRLTKVRAIEKVIPFTSALQYKSTEKPIKEIAKELGVANLLQGNLQLSGNKIKINLQLIHGRSNVHLWSEEYTGEWKSDEIFEMQAEVVEAVARNMRATISENELVAIKKIPTNSKLAYSYYLQGEFQRLKGNELSYSNAINLYEKSIAADSNFVKPYIEMANVWHMGGSVWGFYDQQMAWGNAKVLLEQALKINPENQGVAEELNTGRFFYDWNFELVEQFYKNIVRNSTKDKSSVISLDYPIKTGRPEETLKAVERFSLNDPSNVFYPFFRAEAMFYMGSADEAREILTRTDPLYNDNWFYLRESAKLYYYLAEYEKSKIQLEKILSQFSDYPPILMWLNAVYAQMDGNSEKTLRYLTELQNDYNRGSSGSAAWFLALYYCTTKEYEQAFHWLQKSYDRHEVEMTWLREEPLLAPIRKDARYKNLYEKVGFSSIGIPIKTATEN